MKNTKRIFIILLALLLLSTNAYAIQEDINYLENLEEINISKLKQEIDQLNLEATKIRQNILKTKNGVNIYTQDTLEKLEDINTKILMRYEFLKHNQDNRLDEFIYIQYPLISEVEVYGILSDYNKHYDPYKFFKEQERFKDQIRTDIDFFRNQDFDFLIKFIEDIDLNLEGTNLFFNPYTILNSYGYFQDYNVLDKKYTRRSRIYLLPKDSLTYASTFLHELGHQIYYETVKKDKSLYDEYYSYYKEQFDKHNAKDTYLWQEKLTECFAEDFKIYISKKMLVKGYQDFILSNKDEFLKNDTIYTTHKDLTPFFDKITNYKPINYKLRPSIEIKLDDYKHPFITHEETYTNESVNKFYTNSKYATISLKDKGIKDLKSIRAYSLDDYNPIKITKTSDNYKIKLSKHTLVKLEFDNLILHYYFTKEVI